MAQTRILGIAAAFLFLDRAGRIVAQALHRQGRLGPDPAQDSALGRVHDSFALPDDDIVACERLATGADECAKPVPGKTIANGGDLCGADLKDGAQLFAEKRCQDFARGQIHFDSRSASKGHFQQRDEKSAVRAVVVGEDLAPGR